MTAHFRVAIRCVPSAEEKTWRVDGSKLHPAEETGAEMTLDFDHIFIDRDGHAEVFERAVSPLVEGSLQCGANLGVVMYGLPRSGKTHTAFGTSGLTRSKPEARGVIIRCGQQLLEAMEKENMRGRVSRLTATFCHVFEDGRVADLSDTKKRDLAIEEDGTTALYSVSNLTETSITSTMDVIRLAERGYLMRNATGCLKVAASGRKLSIKPPVAQPLQQYRQHTSHAIFRFKLEQTDVHPSRDTVRSSQLVIVDLAGRSIEQLHSGVACSDTGIEALHDIMRGLPTEGIVKVTGLFPKSSLTKLLKPCFGGNCQTLLVGNVCLTEPSNSSTGRCLQLLQVAREIRNYSKSTLVPAGQSTLGQTLHEIDTLKVCLAEKLGQSAQVQTWEVVNEGVKINDCLFQDNEVTASCNDLMGQIKLLEHNIIEGGKPMVKLSTAGGAFRGASGPPSRGHGPLAMLRPGVRPGPNTMAQNQKKSIKLLSTSAIQSKPTKGDVIEGTVSETMKVKIAATSYSSIDTVSISSSDSELATPLLSGPPPPPLRGIPHVKPDTEEAAATSPATGQSLTMPSHTQTLTVSGHAHTLPAAPLVVHARRQSAPFPLRSTALPDPPVFVSPNQRLPMQTNLPPTSAPLSPRRPLPAASVAIQVLPGSNRRASMPPLMAATVGTSSLPITGGTLEPRPDSTSASGLPQTSTPKAKRSLLSQLSSPSIEPPARPPHQGDMEASQVVDRYPTSDYEGIARTTSMQYGAAVSLTDSEQPTSEDTAETRQDQGLEAPLPHPSRVPLMTVKPAPPSFPPGPRIPRAPLSPIRPVGMAHPLAPNRVRGDSSSSSSSSSTSCSSLTESSDSDLGDEARDTFHPEMQHNQLAMQHNLQYIAAQLQHSGLGTSQHAVLPPISSSPTHPLLPPLISGSPTHPPPQPLTPHMLTSAQLPMYHQSSVDSRGGGEVGGGEPPSYSEHTGTAGGTCRTAATQGDAVPGNTVPVDTTEQLSSDEIHLAALEGVKTSVMKRLVHRYGIGHKDRGGRTPLMYAVLGNQPKMCELLISLGAAIDVRDNAGFSPLLWATYHAKPQVMKTLIRNGANLMASDADGRTVFHWAVKTPQIQCLKLLRKHTQPSIVNKPDNEGLTPLHWAVMCDQPTHIRTLLTSTSIDFSAKDHEGRTALNYAVLNFSPACIKAILDCREGAVNLTDAKGRTALHYACAEGSADCVRTLLLYRCCNLHCTDHRGTTPLHWAAAANHQGLIQLLLRRGSDRAQQDRDGMTALDHTEQRGHTGSAQVLRTYGLRRPSSALSIASHVSIALTAQAPSLDDQGHVLFRRPKRHFSISGVSMSSMEEEDPRQPADGQAHLEASSSREREGVRNVDGERESARSQGDATSTQDAGSLSTAGTIDRQWAFTQSSSVAPSQPEQAGSERGDSSRWHQGRAAILALCSCLGGTRNAVVPMNSPSPHPE